MISLSLGIGDLFSGGRTLSTKVPALRSAPTLSGSGIIGQTVRVDAGGWDGTPTPAITLQWCRDGALISGATGDSYTPVTADDGTALTCRVTASNSRGSAAAESPGLTVRYPVPVAAGGLADLTFDPGDGDQTVDASGDFTGANLTWSVTGQGALIDAATGILTLSTLTERSGVTITVTATNSGGSAQSAFSLTVRKLTPVLQTAPTLNGAGTIGQITRVNAGAWDGAPTPVTTLQWCRNGAPISAATGDSYTPVTADDGTALTCRVTASNSRGSVAAETPAVAVKFKAPVTSGTLADQSFVLAAGDQTLDASTVFTGRNLTWTVTGAGATIKAATGVITLSTAAERAGVTITVTATNSGGSVQSTFRLTVEKPETVDTLWRPVPFRATVELTEEANHPDLWNMGFGDIGGDPTKGRYGGALMQWGHGYARSHSDPDNFIMAQDMGHPRLSRDGGQTWRTADSFGLEQVGGDSILFDPADPDVVFMAATATHAGNEGTPRSNALDDKEGLWRSADRGTTWSPIMTGLDIPGRQRYVQSLLTCWPLTGGTAATRIWKWIALEHEDPGDILAIRAFEGLDGGATAADWSEKYVFTVADLGRTASLVQHPTEKNTLFICSENGLWRTKNWASGNQVWTKPFAGLDGAGSAINSLWIDPEDPLVMFVGSNNESIGFRYTTDGGITWKTDMAAPWGVWAADACNVTASAIGSGCRDVYVHSGNVGIAHMAYAEWDTVTRAFTAEWSKVEGSFNPNHPAQNYRKTTGQSYGGYGAFSWTGPHPTDRNDVVVTGRHHFFKTTTGPTGFFDSNAGAIGTNFRRIWFRKSGTGAGDVMHCAIADMAYLKTTDRFLTMENDLGMPEVWLGSPESGVALLEFPEDSTNPGRVVLAYGGNTQELTWYDPADLEWSDYKPDLPTGKYPHCDFDAQAPDIAYFGSYRTEDAGTSWEELAGAHRFVAMSQQDGATIYALEEDTPWRRIYKSTDRGKTWDADPVHETWFDLTDAKGRVKFWLDPTKGTRFYTLNNSGDLIVRDGTEEISLDLQAALPFVSDHLQVADLAIDPNEPRNIYVICQAYGNDNIQHGRWDAGFTKLEWTGFTDNAGRNAFNGNIQVHPHTSEVIVMTGQGIMVRPPADGRVFGPRMYENMPLPIL